MEYIEIGLQVDCNFRCPYCISEQSDHWEKLSCLDKDKLILWLKTHTKGNELLSLTGGEPLMWRGLEELITSIPNQMLINTNLSLLNKNEWIFNKSLINKICFRIGLHPTVRTDNYIEEIKRIKDFGFHYIVNYMVSNKDIDYKKTEQILIDNNINYELSSEVTLGSKHREKNFESSHLKTWNVIDQNKGAVIRGDGRVLECQGSYVQLGSIYNNTFKNPKRTKRPCYFCGGLKGYSKILSSWECFNFDKLVMSKSRVFKPYYKEILNALKIIKE